MLDKFKKERERRTHPKAVMLVFWGRVFPAVRTNVKAAVGDVVFFAGACRGANAPLQPQHRFHSRARRRVARHSILVHSRRVQDSPHQAGVAESICRKLFPFCARDRRACVRAQSEERLTSLN